MFPLPVNRRYNATSRVIPMAADFAQLGFTDENAKADGYAIRVLGWPYFETDRARAERMTRVHGKGVIARRGVFSIAVIPGAWPANISNRGRLR
jgi:hypothetical protein